MRKRSGLGGTGGRRLSPDLRIHFGTFGFKKGGTRAGSLTSPHTIASVISPTSGQRGHTSFMPRRVAGSMQDANTLLETCDSTNGPPDVRNSVDLGMHNESHNATQVSTSGSYNRLKKKVVLRKPGDSQARAERLMNPKLIKSLNVQPGQFSQHSNTEGEPYMTNFSH